MGDVAAMKDVWHTVRPAQEPWEKEYSVVHRGTLTMTRRTAVDRVTRRVEQQCVKAENVTPEKRLMLTRSQDWWPSRGVLTLHNDRKRKVSYRFKRIICGASRLPWRAPREPLLPLQPLLVEVEQVIERLSFTHMQRTRRDHCRQECAYIA